MLERKRELSKRKVFFNAHHNVVRLIFSLSVQKGGTLKNVDFENTLPYGVLERTVYAEMPVHVFTDAQRKCRVLKLTRSGPVLKDATRTCKKLFYKRLGECGLHEMETALCVFEKTT